MKTTVLFTAFVVISAVTGELCPPIISRSEWGARSSRGDDDLSIPVQYAVIHHSASDECFEEASCKRKVKAFQNHHMDTKDWNDIGYNFIIGGDLNIYEGKGWNHRGIHVGSYNTQSLGICMIGNFSTSTPSDDMMDVLQRLINCAVERGALQQDFKVRGHKTFMKTDCPGINLYSKLREIYDLPDI